MTRSAGSSPAVAGESGNGSPPRTSSGATSSTLAAAPVGSSGTCSIEITRPTDWTARPRCGGAPSGGFDREATPGESSGATRSNYLSGRRLSTAWYSPFRRHSSETRGSGAKRLAWCGRVGEWSSSKARRPTRASGRGFSSDSGRAALASRRSPFPVTSPRRHRANRPDGRSFLAPRSPDRPAPSGSLSLRETVRKTARSPIRWSRCAESLRPKAARPIRL